MATTAVLGSQALLKRGDGNSPEAFITIYEVTSIGEVGEENDLVEATHMLSTAKEYIYGLGDGVEFPVTVNYLYSNSTHAGLINDQRTKTTRNFQLVLPNLSVKFYFSALVRGYRVAFSPNEVMRATFTMKVSGSIIGPS